MAWHQALSIVVRYAAVMAATCREMVLLGVLDDRRLLAELARNFVAPRRRRQHALSVYIIMRRENFGVGTFCLSSNRANVIFLRRSIYMARRILPDALAGSMHEAL